MERALPGLEARVTKLEVRPAALAGVRTQANHRGPPLPAPLSLPPLVPPQPRVPLLVPPQPHVPPLVPPSLTCRLTCRHLCRLPLMRCRRRSETPSPSSRRTKCGSSWRSGALHVCVLQCFMVLLRLWGSLTESCARQQHQVREFLALRCGPCVCLRCDCGQGRLLWLLSRKAALSSCWRSGAIHGLRWWLVRCNCGEAGIDRRTKCGSCWASGACCVAGQMLWQTC